MGIHSCPQDPQDLMLILTMYANADDKYLDRNLFKRFSDLDFIETRKK